MLDFYHFCSETWLVATLHLYCEFKAKLNLIFEKLNMLFLPKSLKNGCEGVKHDRKSLKMGVRV